jgi:cell division protein FtsQ
MKARLAERRAMTRHRAWRAIAIWAGSVAAAAGLGWVVFFSQLLALDPAQITVTGQGTTVSVQEVHAVVAAEAGVPMARINTTELRQEILGLTGVKDAAISRAWPRGMTVEVTARVPVAVIVTAEGFTLVDDEAVYVGVVADLPPGLPLIDVGVSDSGPLLAALRVWAGLPTDLAQQVTGITAATRDDVQMTLSNGTTVHWGSEERIALKVATVKTLLLQAPEAQVIDVSSPELPVTR